MNAKHRVTAKHKLNHAHVNGAVIVAGVLGLATGSLAVFVLAAVGLLLLKHWAGSIRQ